MAINAWKLPWRDQWVPHAAIEINQGCNITCRACYKLQQKRTPKPFKRIKEELTQLMDMRRLSSISLVGGEASLHPELCDIISMIRTNGLHVELITNGLIVDQDKCRSLKAAGLDIIYFHIERGQQRSDLPPSHTSVDLYKLRLEKTKSAAEEGLDVGLTLTAFPGESDDVRDVISLVLETPEINYLLITLYRDNSAVESLYGNIFDGFTGAGAPPKEETRQNNYDIARWMREEFGFEPFGWMGANLDPDDPRWLSYLIGVVYQTDGDYRFEHINPSLVEKLGLFAHRIIKGRYPMYLEQNETQFRKQLRINGLTGGRKQANRELLFLLGKKGARIRSKRILFQNPAELTADGKLLHCEWCPDAIIKNDSLAPVCIADRIS